jgi:DNA-binding CsgD family transcriptional regulator
MARVRLGKKHRTVSARVPIKVTKKVVKVTNSQPGQAIEVIAEHSQESIVELLELIHAAAEALNCLQAGVILLDARGRALFVNDFANAVLRRERAVKLTPMGLLAVSPAEDKKLSELIAQAVAIGKGHGLRTGGTIAIAREYPKNPLHLLVTPLQAQTVHSGKKSAVAAIFITDADHNPVAPSRLLVQLYGLTCMEARIAQLLVSGASIKDASETLNVAQSTVRSHIKNIFAKTRVNRQSDLVRILITGPLQFSLRDGKWPTSSNFG